MIVKLSEYRIKAVVLLCITGFFLLLFSGSGHAGNEVPLQQGNPETNVPADISYEKRKGKGSVSIVEKDDTGESQIKTIRLNINKLKSDNWLLKQYSKITGNSLPGKGHNATFPNLLNGNDEDGSIYGKLIQKEAVKEEKRDPFMPSGLMKEKNRKPKKNWQKNPLNRDEMVFVPTEMPEKMPKMSLRGHIKSNSNNVIALIDIEGGGIHMVREGDTIGLQDMGYDTFIRIKKIGRLHLVVESGALGKLFIVR